MLTFKDYYFVVSLNRQSAQTCKEKLGAFRKGLKKLPLEFGEGRFCQLEFIYFKFEISSLIIYMACMNIFQFL